jgi:tetratricopeptide (TPR) repeat protein
MKLKSLRLILSCLLGAIVAASSGQAAAQLSPEQKLEMRKHYEKATRAYDIEKYGEAVDEYQKAYEIGGDPAMLYNIAQAYRLNDQLPDALHFYRRYLQRSPNARNREDVERKIADLEQSIEARQKEAKLHPPTVTATPVPAEGYLPSPNLVQLPPRQSGNPRRVVGIVLVSVGAAALVTAGITGHLAAGKGDDLTAASKNGGTFDPSLESSGKSLNTIAIVSGIAGGVMAAVGTVLIVASRKGGPEAAPTTTVTPIVGMGTVGASAAVRF